MSTKFKISEETSSNFNLENKGAFGKFSIFICFSLIHCTSGAPDEPSVDTDDEPPVKEEPSPEELARLDSIQRVEDSLYQAEQLAIYRAAELERMEGFIADYYVALENRGYFQAHNWYADEVDQWINKKDLTPDKINEKWNVRLHSRIPEIY